MSAMIDIESLLSWLEWAILLYFLGVNGFYSVLLACAVLEMRRHLLRIRQESRWRVLGSPVAPALSMIAPAHNEGTTVAQSVRALLTLEYPNLEIVLVNDGSSDDTLAVLEREFELVPIHPIYRRRIEHARVRGLYRSSLKPNLVVVDKENGGKADALNAGLNVARGELVCAIDADTLIDPDALLRMARPFLHGSDVVAAGGTVRVANGSTVKGGRVRVARAPRHPLAGIQAVEYLRAFLFGRLGWNRMGGNLIISGAFGLFRREPVIAAGGYLHDTVGEDMELVARLRREGAEHGTSQRVEFIPDPVAWTEVPESLRVLGRQRDRWQRGLADVLWRHRHVMLRPRYGALGFVAFPYFVFVELLAPLVEFVGLIGLGAALAIGAVDGSFALLFFLVAYGFGVLLTCLTLVLDELSFPRYAQLRDRLVLVPWAVLESLGYRQLTAYWRLRGLVKFLLRRKDWGVMTRTGFAVQPNVPGDSST
jgi:cellulose synthase/poly-beta-1,6-N-acetylglucosamine synthase-like glycosyltransferase